MSSYEMTNQQRAVSNPPGRVQAVPVSSNKTYNLGVCWCPFFAITLLWLAGTLVEEILYWWEPTMDFTAEIEKLDFTFINSSSDPIIDIHLTTSMRCPLDYQWEAFGYWPGTVEGCYDSSSNVLSVGNCNDNTPNNQQVRKTTGVPLYKWLGRNLCIKRDNVHIKSPGDVCPTSYR